MKGNQEEAKKEVEAMMRSGVVCLR